MKIKTEKRPSCNTRARHKEKERERSLSYQPFSASPHAPLAVAPVVGDNSPFRQSNVVAHYTHHVLGSAGIQIAVAVVRSVGNEYLLFGG